MPDHKKCIDDIMTKNRQLEDVVGDLKGQIALGNAKASTLENEIKQKESRLNDLQDELDTKTLVIEQLALEKTERKL